MKISKKTREEINLEIREGKKEICPFYIKKPDGNRIELIELSEVQVTYIIKIKEYDINSDELKVLAQYANGFQKTPEGLVNILKGQKNTEKVIKKIIDDFGYSKILEDAKIIKKYLDKNDKYTDILYILRRM